MSRPSLSLFFPCHDEAENLELLLSACDDFARDYDGPLEVIVVDDGSTDASADVLSRLAATRPYLRTVTHPINRGYGAALRSGFAAAKHDLIFFSDGDNQFRLDHLPSFIDRIEAGADAVIGYRSPRQDPPGRKLNAWGWRLFVGTLLGLRVRDIDCAYKLFRREVIESIDFQATGALISTELLVKVFKCGFRVEELPVTHYPRHAGEQSGANPAVIVWAFWELLLLHDRIRRWKGPGRTEREAQHFDQEAETEEAFRPRPGFDYLSHPCLPEHGPLLRLLGQDVAGKRVLDLGCGMGEASAAFAGRGGQVTGVDVSPASLERARRLCGKQGVEAEFLLVRDHRLPFPDATFDVVYGNGVLHHLDLSASLPEIRRVLRPHGVGFFIEPSEGNPLISVYRRLAWKKRTPDERPLGRSDFALLRQVFSAVDVEPFQVATLVAFLKMFLLERRHPSQVSYWREPLLRPEAYQDLYARGTALDGCLKARFPRAFSTLSWNNVICVRP
jgi:SAM-dependent methyltransferase